jgi:hypothetical protein
MPSYADIEWCPRAARGMIVRMTTEAEHSEAVGDGRFVFAGPDVVTGLVIEGGGFTMTGDMLWTSSTSS